MPTHVPFSRRLLISTALAVLVVAILVWLRGSTWQQAEAMLDDLQEGFDRGQARMLLGLVDEQYPFAQRWPELSPLVAQLDDVEDERDLVQRLLVQYFFHNRQLSRSLEASLHDLQAHPDHPRKYIATISLSANVDGHHPSSLRPASVVEHRFVLRKQGYLLPRFTIVDHDPIPLR